MGTQKKRGSLLLLLIPRYFGLSHGPFQFRNEQRRSPRVYGTHILTMATTLYGCDSRNA